MDLAKSFTGCATKKKTQKRHPENRCDHGSIACRAKPLVGSVFFQPQTISFRSFSSLWPGTLRLKIKMMAFWSSFQPLDLLAGSRLADRSHMSSTPPTRARTDQGAIFLTRIG